MRSDNREHNSDIPAPLRALVDLFEIRLADVQFPGVDRHTLADASDQVAAQAAAVAEARRALDDAQRALDAEVETFRALGRRAIAYAEIYADGDDELSAAIQEIRDELGGAAKTAAKGAPPRRRRKKSGSPELPLAGTPAA